ncbi:MAG: acetyl-CoA carboxylase carboxyltransferase subunit alpha [Planctomycetes bacterium]|nr:acetyl-CoA carboxylase carboxyltransferase subunit alpha [Planctomycetota bacterium]
MKDWLDFEKPIAEIDQMIAEIHQKIAAIEKLATTDSKGPSPEDVAAEIGPLKNRRDKLIRKIFAELTPWDRVRLARHPRRPHSTDYIESVFSGFVELHGDRVFGDDRAIVCGLANLGPRRVMVVAHRKGKTTKERVAANFGCAHPEGYRKAMLKMRLAEKFGLPIVTLIDTQGAFPGIGAEERGQAGAIAKSILEMSTLRVPVVSVVIGEGGSGGALGIGVADKLLIMEHAYYSVISPEGCAAILWKDADKKGEAAKALRLTAPDLLELGVVDEVIEEPPGGAHRDPAAMGRQLQSVLLRWLDELSRLAVGELLDRRYAKYRGMGKFRWSGMNGAGDGGATPS